MRHQEILSEAEYLALERPAAWKSEFYRGRITEMSHPHLNHIIVVRNLVCMLAPFLREEGFSVLMSIMRVYVPSERFFAYPDVLILHEKPKLWGDTDDCLLNPASIIEVTTSRTERYDREGKFRSYRGMDSLIEYVTIDSESRFVERWYKTDTWYLDPTKHVDSLKLWDCTLAFDQIYEDVDFSLETPSSAT